uniref:Putative serine/threonine-protein kinase fhkb n=1 Tax=Anopheles marajoara TaxID=58244 RepID=A0A2M4C321_9DIPT
MGSSGSPCCNLQQKQQQQQQQQQQLSSPPQQQRTKFVCAARCQGFVGNRIASRYDEDDDEEEEEGEDEEDGDEDEGEEDVGMGARANGTIVEEDEEGEECEPVASRPQPYRAASYSQNRAKANRVRRSFGASSGRW